MGLRADVVVPNLDHLETGLVLEDAILRLRRVAAATSGAEQGFRAAVDVED